MALGSTQPLTEMSTENISWGINVAGSSGRKPYHFNVPTVLNSRSHNLLDPEGFAQACTGITLPVHLQETDYLVYETVNMFSGSGYCPVPVLF